MADIGFVDDDRAATHGVNLVRLLEQSNDAKVDAWFEALAICEQIGPKSNVGVRGLSWRAPGVGVRRKGEYGAKAVCVDGYVDSVIGGPNTLEEARSPEWLSRVQVTFDKMVEAKGGFALDKMRRPAGTSKALVAALALSPEGSAWLAGRKKAAQTLMHMARVAEAYGRDGVFPESSLNAHAAFVPFDDRADLIREFPRAMDAWRKAAMMGRETSRVVPSADVAISYRVSDSRIATLAIRSGVTRKEARVILAAMLDGRSKTKLIRAVNRAAEMVAEIEAREDQRAVS